MKPNNCMKKMSKGLFKNVIYKTCLDIIYLIYMYKNDLVLNNLQWLICHKTKPNHINLQAKLKLMSVVSVPRTMTRNFLSQNQFVSWAPCRSAKVNKCHRLITSKSWDRSTQDSCGLIVCRMNNNLYIKQLILSREIL